MKLTNIIGMHILLIMPESAYSQPNFFNCQTTSVSGLHYNAVNQEWVPQSFKKQVYQLRLVGDGDRAGHWSSFFRSDDTWALFSTDSTMPQAVCKEPTAYSTNLRCREIVVSMQFDTVTQRITVWMTGSFISQGFWQKYRREHPQESISPDGLKKAPDPQNPDDMFIGIGLCSPE